MTFFKFLRDQSRLIVLWFSLIIMVIFILWLTPDVSLNLSALLYITLIGLIFLGLYLFSDYQRKKNWWGQLEIFSKNYTETPMLTQAHSNEEQLYQDYLNHLIQEHFIELNTDKEQNQAQKDYIDSWVHEIKVPLASLNLITEAIEDDLSEKRYNQLQENLKKIDDYVEQVLYYSRLDSFSKDYLIKSYSLKKMVQAAIRESADDFIQNKLSFSLEGEDFSVLTDEKWLHFILKQLIGNAIKYTPQNGQITIVLSKNERGTWLTLKDTGIGIPPEDLQRIFDKGFTGTNGRNEQNKSTGLGLYLAKSLTEKLGQQLYVESFEGKGSSFSILFPHLNYYAETEEDFMLK